VSLTHPTPAEADVVVIGGGVMGLSTAYNLLLAGVDDVVVVERNALGSGSTCKAAGGVRAQFSDALNIELGMRSLRVFEDFPARFGQDIDFHQVGYLFLLDSPGTVALFEESVALQNSIGVPSRMLSVDEAVTLAPLVDPDGLCAAAYSPTDGHCTPVALGYATAARGLGGRLLPGTSATGIETRGSTITAVLTDRGRIATGTVICTAGAWAQEVGRWVGVDLPVTPLRRQIVVTEPMDGLPPDLPMTLDFSSTFYFHREGPGLLVGMSDPAETPGFKLDRDDAWLVGLGEVIERRAPRLMDVGLTGGWAGLYEMTPDHNALIGQAADVDRFLYAAGFSGHGFLMSPAVGEVLRDLYLGWQPYVDISPLDARRFAGATRRPETHVI
jgi:sarcosine oxidase subunit beta